MDILKNFFSYFSVHCSLFIARSIFSMALSNFTLKDPVCMKMDEVLYGIAEKVKNFAIIYVVDITEVPGKLF